FNLAGDDLEKRRLPRAVVPDQAHALAAVNEKVQSAKDHAIAEGLFDVGECDNRHFTDPRTLASPSSPSASPVGGCTGARDCCARNPGGNPRLRKTFPRARAW